MAANRKNEDVQAIQSSLLQIAILLGELKDFPYWASFGLAARVYATGKPLEQLTLGHLKAIFLQQARDHEAMEERVTAGCGGYLSNLCPGKVVCREQECQSRGECPHSLPHDETEKCSHVCGADAPFARCEPIKEGIA